MWLHYLKAAFRALTSQRFFSFVNLLGLSIGLASVVAISLYVREQLSYDAWLPDHERLFRIDTVETIPDRESLAIARTPGPLREALTRDFPQVEAVTRGYHRAAQRPARRADLRRGCDGRRRRLLRGARPALRERQRRASARQPHRHRPERAGGGEIFRARERGRPAAHLARAGAARVRGERGVRDDPRGQPHEFDVAIPHAAFFRPSSDGSPTIPESWAGAYFHTYARLRDPADAAIVARGLPAFTDRHVPSWITDQLQIPAHEFYDFRLVPVRDAHFDGAAIDAMKPPGSRTTVAALPASPG